MITRFSDRTAAVTSTRSRRRRVGHQAAPLLLASMLIGCSAVPSGSSTAASPAATVPGSPVAATPVPSRSAPPSPTAEATASSFTSTIYQYQVGVPGGWTSVAATAAWDGVSGVSSDSPQVDRWVSVGVASAWASAAAYDKDLKSYAAKTIADTTKYHGDTCTAPPESQEPITVGGEPGTLIAWNCGILINIGVTVHDGIGYTFGFRDPAIAAATDPADHDVFLDLLKSVKFPA